MRKTYALFFSISVYLILAVGCASNKQISMLELENKFDKRVYEIFGMDCPGCHGGVEKLVGKIPGIQHAEANWEKNQLVLFVERNKTLSDEDIYNAIKNANFTPGKRLK